MKPKENRLGGLARVAGVLCTWGLLSYGVWVLYPPAWPLMLGACLFLDLYVDRWVGRKAR